VIYIDTSCLLKLFRAESLSEDVQAAITVETSVIISSLTELETLVQLKACWSGGEFSRTQWRRLETEFNLLRHQDPFEFRSLPSSLHETALRQHKNSGLIHCRTLDRLHLAAMEELKTTRLMTHDEAQAKAALEAGFQIVRPGHE
jgi:predicted nucleic acid-binding protein